jgi:hypothetical protein
MTELWKKLLAHLSGNPGPAPIEPARPPGKGFPVTYRSGAPNDGAWRARLFEPALKHYGAAYRPGDPQFVDEEAARRWVELRRAATDHVLRRIAESPWGDGLVLRGSRLLRAWLGEEAREPGDLDWVADPPSVGLNDPWSAGLFAGLPADVLERPQPPGVEFIPKGVAHDEIWTYERVPGKRVVFPWRSPDLPGGTVQVDVVFGESLAEPPRRMPVPLADGGSASVRGAGPAQSLAWKLLWLSSDMHPQGKDLYDAVLLAERFFLPTPVLEQTFRLGRENLPPGTAAEFVDQIGSMVDWENFQAEYPRIGGDEAEWLARLALALGPTFSGRGAADFRTTGGEGPDE